MVTTIQRIIHFVLTVILIRSFFAVHEGGVLIDTVRVSEIVFLIASGAVVRVFLDEHLKEVCNSHSISITKKNSTIGDYNEIDSKQ